MDFRSRKSERDNIRETRTMKSIQEFREEMSQRRGAIAVLSVVFLVMILAFASFSVDFGYMVLVDQEMQSAVDGAALAAAQELQLAPDGGQNQVVSAAVDLAAANTVNGQNLTLQPRNDVDIGTGTKRPASLRPSRELTCHWQTLSEFAAS
jgi:Flp pilus assembly protein TadG